MSGEVPLGCRIFGRLASRWPKPYSRIGMSMRASRDSCRRRTARASTMAKIPINAEYAKKTIYPVPSAAGLTPDRSTALTKLSGACAATKSLIVVSVPPASAARPAPSTIRPDCEARSRPGIA